MIASPTGARSSVPLAYVEDCTLSKFEIELLLADGPYVIGVANDAESASSVMDELCGNIRQVAFGYKPGPRSLLSERRLEHHDDAPCQMPDAADRRSGPSSSKRGRCGRADWLLSYGCPLLSACALNLVTDSADSRILDNVFRPSDFTVRRATQYVVRRKLCLRRRPDEPLIATRARQAYLFYFAHFEFPHFRFLAAIITCPIKRNG
jgi:hypothetical protein